MGWVLKGQKGKLRKRRTLCRKEAIEKLLYLAEFFEILCEIINSTKVGVLLASSDLMELVGMCDRIYVFRNRKVVREFLRQDFSNEDILEAMLTGL